MAGRGRGRGKAAILQRENNPGGLQDSSADADLEAIKKFVINKDLSSAQSIIGTARTYCVDKQSMTRVVSAVYSPCFDDWRCSMTSGYICNKLLAVSLQDVSFRDVLLQTIQSDYQERESMRLKSRSRFMGFVAFLSQVFKHLRVNEQPVKVLAPPVCQCISQLLDDGATEEEVQCGCEQLQSVGALLFAHADRNLLMTMKISVKDQILNDSLTRAVRMQLLDLLEAMASNWNQEKT